MTPSILQSLLERAGRYEGSGLNHAGEAFRGKLDIDSLIGGTAIRIGFQALDGESVFHKEETWVAPDLVSDKLGLWTISSNTPGVLHLELRRDESDGERERILVFGFNHPDDESVFRQEIALDLWKNGDLGYRFSWGIPHQGFAPRSSVRLTRQGVSRDL